MDSKNFNLTNQGSSALLRISVLFLACALIVRPASAATFTLTDNGASASINTDSSAGMYNWTVGGQNQLNQQWFWYRIGNGIAQPINTISTASILYSSGNTLVARYATAQFSLTISYLLNGGSGGHADIIETISVTNASNSSLNFHLFQYSDFNLLGSPLGDTVRIGGSGPGYDSVIQEEGTFAISETVTSPPADRGEVDYAYNTLNNLNGVAGYNLGDSGTSSLGPITGDVTWSFQWDRQIGIGGGLDIFKDKSLSVPVVPEPSTLALILAGLGAGKLFARRRL